MYRAITFSASIAWQFSVIFRQGRHHWVPDYLCWMTLEISMFRNTILNCRNIICVKNRTLQKCDHPLCYYICIDCVDLFLYTKHTHIYIHIYIYIYRHTVYIFIYKCLGREFHLCCCLNNLSKQKLVVLHGCIDNWLSFGNQNISFYPYTTSNAIHV